MRKIVLPRLPLFLLFSLSLPFIYPLPPLLFLPPTFSFILFHPLLIFVMYTWALVHGWGWGVGLRWTCSQAMCISYAGLLTGFINSNNNLWRNLKYIQNDRYVVCPSYNAYLSWKLIRPWICVQPRHVASFLKGAVREVCHSLCRWIF